MATNSQDVVGTMLTTIERDIIISLRQINESPEWFDNFEQQLLPAVNSITKIACFKYKMELQLAQKGGAVHAALGVDRNDQEVGNSSNPLGGRSGPSVKIDPIGPIVELSDDEEETLVSKIEVDVVHSENDYRGNEQKETTAAEELISNNRTIQNSESVTPSSPSENEPQIADDSSSISIAMGSDNMISNVIMDRPDLVKIQTLETEQRNPSGGRSGPSIKIEPIGEIVELSDDEEDTLVSKIEIEEIQRDNNFGNKQIETYAHEELFCYNRSIQNSGNSASDPDMMAICLNSEIRNEVPNKTPSNLIVTGAENMFSNANMGMADPVEIEPVVAEQRQVFVEKRPARVIELNRCDGARRSGGAKNVQKSAKDKQKRYKCQICGHISLYKGNLKVHIRKHTGERPYRCKICLKRFNLASDLERHQLTHVRQYEFRCVGCARGFNEEIEKVRHDKVCEKRRYECYLCKIDPPHCHRTFATNATTNLKIHMRIHTGEKPFRCEICMKRFKRKTGLKYHLNNVHSRTNYLDSLNYRSNGKSFKYSFDLGKKWKTSY